MAKPSGSGAGDPAVLDRRTGRLRDQLAHVVEIHFLAIGAIFAGWLAYDWFVGENMAAFWGKSILILEHHHALHAAHEVPGWVKLAPLVVGVAGIALAYALYMFNPDVPGKPTLAIENSITNTAKRGIVLTTPP